MKHTDLNWFKGAILKGAPPGGAILTKASIGDSETIEDSRKVVFTISNSNIDRDQDSIDAKGWDLVQYIKNPVVLFSHDQKSLPIGRVTKLFQDNLCLKAEVEFADATVNPLAENVYQGVVKGFINATSVGFRPLEFAISTDETRTSKAGRLPPIDFSAVELLELSIVTVPSNPDALVASEVEPAKQVNTINRKALRQRQLVILAISK